jgi:hypothetical protein
MHDYSLREESKVGGDTSVESFFPEILPLVVKRTCKKPHTL